jgi:hypothetical protein
MASAIQERKRTVSRHFPFVPLAELFSRHSKRKKNISKITFDLKKRDGYSVPKINLAETGECTVQLSMKSWSWSRDLQCFIETRTGR